MSGSAAPPLCFLSVLQSLFSEAARSVVDTIHSLSKHSDSSHVLGARYRFAVVPPARPEDHQFEACAVYEDNGCVIACPGGCAPPLAQDERIFCTPRGAGGVLSFWLPSTEGWRERVKLMLEELMGKELVLTECSEEAAPASLFIPQPCTPAPWWGDRVPAPVPEAPTNALLPGLSFLTRYDRATRLQEVLVNMQRGVVSAADKAVAIMDADEVDPRRSAYFHALWPFAQLKGTNYRNDSFSWGLFMSCTSICLLSGNPNEVLAALICLSELATAPLLEQARDNMLAMYLARRGAALGLRRIIKQGPDCVQTESRTVDGLTSVQSDANVVTGLYEREDDEYMVAEEEIAAAASPGSESQSPGTPSVRVELLPLNHKAASFGSDLVESKSKLAALQGQGGHLFADS